MSKKPSRTINNPLSSEDEQRIKRLVADFEARLRKSFSEPDGTLHEIEIDVSEIGKAITEQLTKEKIDKIASAPYGSRCQCRLEALGDGAEWIWIEFTKAFPRAVQVLDYYHLMEKLGTFAKVRYNENTKQVDDWLRLQRDNLLVHGDAKRVEKDIEKWHPTRKGDQEVKRTTLCYVQEHRSRTNYKELRHGGLDIGSGIMESGCKTMKARLGGPGMRWEEPGAASMLHLTSLFHASAESDFLKYTQN